MKINENNSLHSKKIGYDERMTKQITASEMGKIGGSRKSPAKTTAARENARKPRSKKNADVDAPAHD